MPGHQDVVTKPLACWSLGPLNCEMLTFRYVNAIPGVGYNIRGKSWAWYFWQERKADWNGLVRRFCRERCPHVC